MQAGGNELLHKSPSGKSLPTQNNTPFCLSPIQRSASQRNSPFCLSPVPRSDSPYSRSSSPGWSQHFNRVAELWEGPGSSDPGQLWEAMRREKAARGYPWTHLDHNQEEEVWLNPLSLPKDIGRETVKRRDGTIPAEWFHLPDGASPPSVQDMLKDDSPEPDYADSDTAALPAGHSSPPLCGRHRNSRSKSRERRLHKPPLQETSSAQCRPHPEPYSTGQTTSTVQATSTVHTNGTVHANTVQSSKVVHAWQPLRQQQQPQNLQPEQQQKQPPPGYEPVGSSSHNKTPGYEPVGASTNNNHPGYEPVGGSTNGSNKGMIPVSRSPSSRLPTLPTQESLDDNDSDVTPGCFSMIRRSRSRSKSKEKLTKKGKPPRSASECSAHSDHPYETPKLLTKSDHTGKPSTPKSKKKKRSDIEDGYEPVGTLEDWINHKEKEYEDLENKEELESKEEKFDRSNVSMNSEESQKTLDSQKSKNASEHLVTIKETDTGKVIFKEKFVIKTEKEKQEKDMRVKQEKEQKEKRLKEEKEQKERKLREQQEQKEQKARKKKEEKEIKEKRALEEKEQREKRAKEEKEQKELKAKNEREIKEQKAIREKEEKLLKEKQNIEENKKKEEQKYEKQQKLQKEKEEREKRLQQEKEEKQKKLIDERLRKEKEAERNFLYPIRKESKVQDNFENSIIIEENKMDNKNKLIEENESKGKVREHNIQKPNEKEIEFIENYEHNIIIDPNKLNETPASVQENKPRGKIEIDENEKINLDKLDNMQEEIINKENEMEKMLNQEAIIMQKEIEKQERKQRKLLAKKEKDTQEKELKQKELEKLQEQEKRKQNELEKMRPEEETKRKKELEKQEEKERKALVKKEKEMQAKELKELKKAVSKEKKAKLLNKSFFKFITKSKSMSDIGNEDSQKKIPAERDFEDVEFNTEGKSLKKLANKKREEVYEPVSPSPPPSCSKPCEGTGQEHSNITQPTQQPSPPGQPKHTDMALRQRAQKGEVSVVTSEDFAAFQHGRDTNLYHDEDEEMDFTPQNGYIDPEEEEMVDSGRNSRSQVKPSFVNRISSFRLPSPNEFKLNYLNSNFHKSFHQPLSVKNRIEDQEVIRANQELLKAKSVHELSQIHSLSDFPIPNFWKKSEKQGTESEEAAPSTSLKMPTNMEEVGQMAYNTLPKSWREQNIVTAHKENLDPDELEERQNLTKTKTPAELAQFNSLADIPVPSIIKNLFDKKDTEAKDTEAKEPKKRRHSDSESSPPSPFNIYHTLPRSLRETKLITNIEVCEDDSVLEERRALVENKTPAELSAITKISDFPIPDTILNIFKSKTPAGSKQGSIDDVNKAKRRRSRSASIPKGMIPAFYNSLPRQLTTQNIVTSVKTEEDLELLEKHRKLTQTKTVSELSAITSIADLPMPTKLENLFKGGDKKEKDSDDTDLIDSTPTKPKLNFSKMNLNDMYNTLPKSLTMELSVGSPVELDRETAEARKKLTEEKTPMELSQIGSFADFPIPSALENIFVSKPTPPERKRDREEKRKRNLTTGAFLSPDFIPTSWTETKLLVKQTEEEPSETLLSRRDLVESKKPMELSEIHGFSDFPIPERVETLLRPKKRVLKSTEEKEMSKKVSRSWSSLPTDTASMYATLPKSFKQELIVGSRVEDPEVVAERREIVKNKSVSELSQIHSFSDFPIPASIENFFKQKLIPSTANGGPPVATPVISRPTSPQSVVDSVYESLPRVLTGQQLLVKSKMVEDDEKLQERRAMTSLKSPAELSQITSFADIPIPTPIENLLKMISTEAGTEGSPVPPPRKKWEKEDLYESIPSSLREELLVKQLEEDLDPEELSQRQELVKTKSPAELSQIGSFGEFPIPDCVENFVHKIQAGVEKSEEEPKTEEATDSPPLSTMESIYASIPSSLKTGLIVKTVTEDPEIQQARAEIVKSKSVHELSQINSIAEFPIPTAFENLAKRAHGPIERKKKFKEMEEKDTTDEPPKSMSENIYATLPKSLTSELAVKSVVEDQEITAQRREIIKSKSVSELASIHSLADIPIPDNIERLIAKAANLATNEPKEDNSSGEILSENTDSPQVPSRNMKLFDGGIYASLPRSLKSELLVRREVIEDEEILQQRQELIATKSPAELSQIHSLAEIPIPSRIEAWLHGGIQGTEDRTTIGEGGQVEESRFPRSIKEFNDAFYQTFPSMDTHCVVRSKVEDPDVLINRQQLSQNRSIHELSQINNLNEFPIPGDLFRLPDIPLPKVSSILKLIARSPSQKKAPVESETYHSYQCPPGPNSDSDVMSTPMTEDGMFHSMGSQGQESPSSSITKDRELGYEIISRPIEDHFDMIPAEFQEDILENLPTPPPPAPEYSSPSIDSALPAPPTPDLEPVHDGFGLAGLTKGTPERNVRSKTKKKNRRSQDIHDDGVMSISSTVTDDIPPALPPKRGSPQKGMSLESHPSLDDDIELEAIPVKNVADLERELSPPLPPRREKSVSKSVEPREMTDQVTPELRIQSRPLPPPPAPPRTLKKQSSGSVEPEDGRLSSSSNRSGLSALRDDLTYADTENFKSAAETLNSSRTMRATETQQFHTVADTLESHTLLVTGKTRNSEDDLTLADSVVDSLHSCCETLIVDNEHENLDTCADTLTAAELDDPFYDDDDNPYPSVDFNAMMHGPGGHIVEPESPAVVRDSGASRRLEEGAEELSKELLEHVENLKTTLTNMSTRLGSSSKSDL